MTNGKLRTILLSLVVIVNLPDTLCRGSAQQPQLCVPDFPEFSRPSKQSSLFQKQLVIPQYVFLCNATVTQWEALVNNNMRSQLQLLRLDFQVWRLHVEQGKYYLAGNNSFIAGSNQQGVKVQRDRLVIEISDPEDLIAVTPGDIVGVYVEGVEIRYTALKNALTYYQVNLDGPLLEGFDADFSTFRSTKKGIPLIRALTDDYSFSPMITATGSPLATQSSTTPALFPTPSVSSVQDAPTRKSTYEEDSGGGISKTLDPVYFVGGTLGLVVAVFIAVASFVLAVVLVRRRKRGGHPNHHGSPSLPPSSEGTLLPAHLQLDTLRKLNYSAFKKQETAVRGTVPSRVATSADCSAIQRKDIILSRPKKVIVTEASTVIRMNENTSYSSLLNSTGSNVAEVSSEYKVPVLEVNPCEYEIPIDASLKNEYYEVIPEYEVIPQDKIYDEID